MSDKIIIKGKLISRYAVGNALQATHEEAAIELSPEELAGQLTFDEAFQILYYNPNKKELPQPQQFLKKTREACHNFPISACCNASVKLTQGTASCYTCEACQRPCDLAEWNKPQQEFCVCEEPELKSIFDGYREDFCFKCHKPIPSQPEAKLETCGISVKDDSRTYGCPHCGRPIRKTELASEKEDELENILICFGENFGEIRLENIDRYVREGKEKILALVGKIKKPEAKKEIEELDREPALSDFISIDTRMKNEILIIKDKLNEIIRHITRKD